ncbi:MAG: hypothetical protein ACOC80_15710 [Petrotogales bacterium]
MSKKVRAYQIKKALEQYHSDPSQWTIFFEVKNGPTWTGRKGELLIMDGLAIKKSWTQPQFVGYEIKCSRSDFLQDEKWTRYLEYCHKFYFVCPKGLISRGEIESMNENVGLMYYHEDYENCGLHTMKAPAVRDIEISAPMMYYIIMSKLEPDRYPFFSDKKRYFKKWFDNKQDNKNLGITINGKIGETIVEQEKRLEKMNRKVESIEKKEDIIWDVIHYLDRKGLLEGWSSSKRLKDDWKEKLDEMLGSNLVEHEKYKIEAVIDAAEGLKKLI